MCLDLNFSKSAKKIIFYCLSIYTVKNAGQKKKKLKEKIKSKTRRWARRAGNYSTYSETLNNENIERIHQMSYSSLSDNGMLHIFSFLIK